VSSGFPGFPPEMVQFFRGLKRNNRREWFQPRKHLYEQHVKAPMLELVTALNGDLMKFAPLFVTEPKRPSSESIGTRVLARTRRHTRHMLPHLSGAAAPITPERAAST
jgi:uncharacterized protein (DUF2461 family)